ncbi:hypothetical protein G6M89_10560 [Natronolimnobius sp. AArcel1]|uniref:hypothetical protein n=1 Tax=Natronolimnobius sp. AArcel1 TaxID=1679093 RepID=UPI0013ED2079|nr:hypothetical protein [Natronolimnobius sp. AArcel1]NGM69441.1 hypothetical protein [Natronolimnobius sp. AArcel1]
MSRFDATEPADRQKLYVDAITAHRERASGYLTLEADSDSLPEDNLEGGVPWVQFGDGTLNLDCTDDELDELKDLLSEFAAFTIDAIVRPEELDGINVHISATADHERVAQLIEAVFRRVYGLPEDGRVWVTEI